jgi:protein-tyrosine phosphatase
LEPATILFVCTGNLCRSPLAEAAAHQFLKSHFRVADLAHVGLRTTSAGTHAITGQRSTPEMRMAAREVGLDLAAHRSKPVEAESVRAAALIFVMEQSHADWLSASSGRSGVLLDGDDIDDPYGQDLDAYRFTRDTIVAAVRARLPEMIELAS